MTTVEKVFNQNESRLMAVPGVEGVGIGGTRARPVILVMVRKDAAAMAGKLPREIDGIPVKVEVSGEISAY
jgi:hypothetical protein